MTELTVIGLSALVLILVTLMTFKVPLMQWYYRFKREIWHHWLIWKIERNIAKTSVDKENPLLN